MFHLAGREILSKENNLWNVVEKLATLVPVDATDVVVIVHTDFLGPLTGTVEMVGLKYPIRFDPTSENFPEGVVCIGFGKGNLESYPAHQRKEEAVEGLNREDERLLLRDMRRD